MIDNKKIYLAVLFSVLGYILANLFVKILGISESNYAMYGIIFVGLSASLYKKSGKITPLVFFLINFICTIILVLLLKYLFIK